MPIETTLSENTVRSRAKNAGYALRKSRVHEPHANDRGMYMLVTDRGTVALGSRFDATLEDVEHYINANGPSA